MDDPYESVINSLNQAVQKRTAWFFLQDNI